MWSYALVRPQVTTAASSKLLNKLQYIENGTVRLLTSSWSHHPCPLVLLSSCPAVDRFQSPSLYSQPPHTLTHLNKLFHHHTPSCQHHAGPEPISTALPPPSENPSQNTAWVDLSTDHLRHFCDDYLLMKSQQTNKKMSVDVVSRSKSGRSVTAIKKTSLIKKWKIESIPDLKDDH